MSFKHILAFVSGLPTDAGVLTSAIAVARMSRGHLDTVFIMPDAQQTVATASMGAGLPVTLDEFVDGEERRIAENEDFAHRAFAAAAGGLPKVAKATGGEKLTVYFRSVRGRLDEIAATEGLYADLLVSARPADETDARHTVLAETLLFETGRPVLFVPPIEAPVKNYQRIVIGWCPTPHTVRAIHEAIPLLLKAKSVDVVGIGADQDPGIIAERLRTFGIPANAIPVESDNPDTAKTLLRLIDARNAELFVMGGYGHSRVRETLLGGVTKTMMSECEASIFACH